MNFLCVSYKIYFCSTSYFLNIMKRGYLNLTLNYVIMVSYNRYDNRYVK